jgi:PmbA protein
MNSGEALEAAHAAVVLAREAGAGEAEARIHIGRRFSAEARADTITKLEQSTGRSLTVRVFVDGRKATLATADFDTETLRAAVARAVDQARYVAPDPFAALPQQAADGVDADLELFDAAVEARGDAAGAQDALQMEREIRAADARVDNSNGSHYSDSASLTALVNSHGFAGSYRSTRVQRSASPVATESDGVKRTSSYGSAARHVAELEGARDVAHTAARRAVELFGARKPPTMRVPVIFERDAAAVVLDDVFAAINAANVAVGNSWLVDRIGERIGSEAVTLVDDGRLPRLLGSAPFDAEGVATRRTVVFERGVLRSFLYDSYHARKAGTASTGNSSGGSIGPNTFYLEAGSRSLAEVVAATPRGVLVLDTIGFATEHATGTYSRGARGFFIENGEIAYPIDEFTIAAALPDMLAGIDAVANDLRFDASIASPSFRVAEMTVSGN